jgi:serine protease Do
MFTFSKLTLGAESSTANQVFNSLKDQVFQIRVARNLDAAKSTYGSGFPVDKNGLLATNYHVIRQSFEKDFEFHVYVKIADKNYPAQVLAVDVVHDLAIVKIDYQFPEKINIAKSSIRNGDKIFSMGFPQDLPMTIVEGTYNGFVKRGVYEEIHMSSGINSGMSGGPTLNKSGKLIGVNVSTMLFSNNISFAVPANFVGRLLKTIDDNSKPLSSKDIDKVIQVQLASAQEGLSSDLLNKELKTQKFHGWKIVSFPEYIKCWQNVKKGKHEKYQIEKRNCNVENAARINDDLTTGYYKSGFRVYSNTSLNDFQFYNKIYTELAGNIPSDQSGFFQGFKKEDGSTKAECETLYILNNHKIPFKINYCLLGYRDYENLYDAYFDGVSLVKKKEELVFSMSFFGFSSSNIKKIISKYINAIQRED